MSKSEQHAVSLRNVTKAYGTIRAMDDVSLDVAPGEFLSLLGPSGSGKSTILMAIAGFVKPDGGDILLDGRSVTALPPEARNFGVVFQGYALFPHMTVAENVGYPLKLRKVGKADIRERVARVLDQVHLTAFAERYPRQLSGGQQQRVALARALVFEPSVILLDEPLSALDKKLRAELQLELKALHARLGMTFINVTHDQEEAMTMSDRIVILHEGRIQQTGAPESLYRYPATRFVADFLGRANFLEGAVAGVSDGIVAVRHGDAEVRVPQPEGGAAEGRCLIALRPERIAITHGTAAADEGQNSLACTVLSAIFTGSQVLYQVETAFGELLVLQPSFGASAAVEAGTPAALAWPLDAGVIVTP